MSIQAATISGNQSGALFEVAGTVPTNATWSEDIYFTENGAAMDLTGLSFKMTFRRSEDDSSAEFSISTASGEMSIVEDADAAVYRILRIMATDGTFNAYSGEYIADLASEDGSGVVTLWAHGIITFVNNPVAF